MKRVLFVLLVLGLALGPSVVADRATEDGVVEASQADDGRVLSRSGPSADSSAARENLAASAAWDDAFNLENLDALMALYADGAVAMPPGSQVLVGKELIQEDFKFIFANFDIQHQTRPVQLEIQGPMAADRGEYTMTVAPADRSESFVENGKHIVVRRKINGSWLVVMEIWNTH